MLRWSSYCATLACASVLAAAGFAQESSLADVRIAACRPGFGGVFVTGYWTPVTIELTGGTPGSHVEVELLAPDDDGVTTVVHSGASQSAVFDENGRAEIQMITKIGRIDATLTVNLLSGGRVVRSRSFVAGQSDDRGGIPTGLPAHTDLVLHVGAASLDLPEALRPPDPNAPDAARHVVRVDGFTTLPDTWFGYDSVSWLVVSTSDRDLIEEVHGNLPQLEAIARWVEMGGRLLVVCGQHAPQLIAPGEPLAPFVPGELQEMVSLDTARALEQFSGTGDAVVRPGESLTLSVPRLGNVYGRVEVAEGNLPLVVRAARGFGMLVFAGVDLDAAPLDAWNGRPQFMRRLLRISEPGGELRTASSQTITTRGYDDLAGALRNRLGSEFAGVSVVPFSVVTLLVLVYLVLVGPADYFLVKWLGRMEWTWLTFPAMILLVSWGAYALAHARKGDQHRLNQVELVDLDVATGNVRGSLWACVYSPTSSTYDVSLIPHWPNGTIVDSPEVLLSWFGMPGRGLGGMSAENKLPTTNSTTYRYGSQRATLSALPIETWSTKSLTGRWTARAPQWVTATLEATQDDLVQGTVRNDSGVPLTDVRLLYGTWGWRLGELPPGRTITIDNRIDPLKVRTLLTRSLRDTRGTAPGGRGVFVPEQAEVDELLDVITFYEATGGRRFSQLANRYQSHCDLSHLLDLGHAVLMARCDHAGSELRVGDRPLGGGDRQRWTIVRFVIPVSPAVESRF